MRKLSHLLALVALCCIAGKISAQQGSFTSGLESWTGYTSNGTVPFWLRSNRFGSVPVDGASFSLVGFARKDYDLSGDRLFDWGASFEGRANLGNVSDLTLIEGYGKIRLGIFELRAGRSKKITGLCDTTLTSGSWAISGNSPGIPEVELSVRDFRTIPWFGELFAFKGNFSHGWMGKLQMSRFVLHDTLTLKSYLHQKSLYGRFGKPAWRTKFYGGINHQVVWGSEQTYYLDDYTLKPWETYYYVVTGKRFSNGYIQDERQGNHLGSVDIGMEYRFNKVKVIVYRQNLYETGALANFANIQDGLNGISFENLKDSGGTSRLNHAVIEILYTKNQAGRPWSPYTSSFYEGYYNHGQYLTGWSYNGIGLGTPFISTRAYVRDDLPSAPQQFFINNRVLVLHAGLEGYLKDVNFLLMTSWSSNIGTYWTSDEEQSTNITDPGEYGIFEEQNQLSAYLELSKQLKNGLNLAFIWAYDQGTLLNNSFAGFLKTSYNFGH